MYPDIDEQLGKLMAASARLERADREHSESIESMRLDMTRVKSELQGQQGEMRALKYTIDDFAKLAEGMRSLQSVLNFLKLFAVVTVLGLVGFVLNVVRMQSEQDALRRALVELKERQAFDGRGVQAIDTNLRSMSAALDEWKTNKDKQLGRVESKLERLEERRR
jgi:hypothetical protein